MMRVRHIKDERRESRRQFERVFEEEFGARLSQFYDWRGFNMVMFASQLLGLSVKDEDSRTLSEITEAKYGLRARVIVSEILLGEASILDDAWGREI